MLPIVRTEEDLEQRLQTRRRMFAGQCVAVDDILSRVRENGDEAVRNLTQQYDGISVDTLRVSRERSTSAADSLSPELHSAISAASDNIRRFHEKQLPESYSIAQPDGTRVSFRWRPVERAGVYTPSGRFPLFSSVLMNVIPAQVAGVREIALCSPPGASGYPSDFILAVCGLLGVPEVYRVGGAQAVAALAYGTESIPAVDKITGPGNVYVAAAKQAVSASVGIDVLAGPTELVVMADESADPVRVATDLVSQAEHDPQVWSVLLTISEETASEVNCRLEDALGELPTRAATEAALVNNGFVYVADSIDSCIAMVNRIAPEHLSLQVENPGRWVDAVTAGAVFVGSDTPVAWGDYWAGANHTLPTTGQARFRGPLSVYDFLVPFSVIESPQSAVKASGRSVVALADAEGLSAHARSIELRMEDG
ncbi:MAG: histidinol dehydrogenase [Candidatus Marinimicrobia bacterium]|nr:histidinol dehydrogenase [Candidatus Neomarinimicrobiota bacterium]MDP6592973.1 histidinol dehydrogenase [Candidatus Neomarinimicrobiota bacterium]MDP6835941.1 histidinol dehydrogenase [Candidatus Neomarinimicrobiota bacterium]MDP6965974.1 histidinol dehydrogenase [Candidatus Neomarinimicrobiota bacterium]|tara:strand:- start:11161 stop:12435 length:1275 start_codon:yes stop_codon:yes gene_type:complete